MSSAPKPSPVRARRRPGGKLPSTGSSVVEEQRLYLDSLLDDWTVLSLRESPAVLWRRLMSATRTCSLVLSVTDDYSYTLRKKST